MQHIEEQIAHLIRSVDDLSDVVLRQQTQIDQLDRRIQMLMRREAEREAGSSSGMPPADRKPPHW
jgi:SlyX protein